MGRYLRIICAGVVSTMSAGLSRGLPELGRQQVAGSGCMAFVIIQGSAISARMLCGTQGASHETVSVQRRRSVQPQDCEDAAF
jgi:hypothetical protein